MKFFTVILFGLVYNTVAAQVSTTMDIRATDEQGFGTVQFNNPSALGSVKKIELKDDEIAGTAFWKNDWNRAYVFLTSGKVVALNQAKLNLKTNEVYFTVANSITEATDANSISKIIFVDKKDSLKTIAFFQKLDYDGNSFSQVLNAGEYQLLKAIKVTVIKRDYNTLLGKDEYAYDQKTAYYFFHDGKFTQLDVLNKDHLAALINLSGDNNKWLADNRNKLHSESDWINFLNYYNNKQ